MGVYFLWGSIALILIVLLCGFFIGLYRGLKRSSLHVLFVLASVLVAFFVTKPITNSLLGIIITVDGTNISIREWIVQLISENVVDLSNFDTASSFIQQIPTAIINPIVFLIITLLIYLVLDIIYLVVARVSFGSKRKDFSEKKAYRLPGAFIGMVESFMFMIILFAPIVSLTQTYEEIVVQATTANAIVSSYEDGDSTNHIPTISEILGEQMPSEVGEAIYAFNDSAIGVICSAGGFDDAMFDGLSSFTIDGEKINFRPEIINIAHSYDSIAVFVNDIFDENYANLDFTPVKENVTKILDNGLFKKVITDTLQDFITNYETLSTELEIEIPAEVQEILTAIRANFSNEGFSFYDYLSNDIKILLDTFDNVVESGTFSSYMIETPSSTEAALDFVVNNETTISKALKDILGLNLATDALPTALEYASDTLESQLENEDGLFLGLNTSMTKQELSDTVDSLMSVLNDVKTLNDTEDILSIFNSDDILNEILNLNDVSNVLDTLGEMLDEANSIKLFSYETESGENVKVLQNILAIMGIDVLGDEVHGSDGSLATINTYSEFFDHIKTPIVTISDKDLIDAIQSEADMDAIIDILTTEIVDNGNTDFLADLIMPFYELDEASFNGTTLKALVFDAIVTNLESGLDGFVALDAGEDTYEKWTEKFASVGELLTALDGQYDDTQTYLDYLLTEGADYFALINKMNEDGAVSDLLGVIFGNEMYQPLNETIFSAIDTQVGNFTNLKPTTNIDNLYTQKDEYISVITTLISSLDTLTSLSDDIFTDPNADLIGPFTTIGTVLDTLKVSAQNDVFDEIYVNLVWYVTGDKINPDDPTYIDKTTDFEYADKVREFFGVEDPTTGYYELNFSAEVQALVDFIKLGNQIVSNLEDADLTTDTGREEFVDNIKQTLDEIENPQEIVDKATQIVDVVLTEEQKQQIQDSGEEVATAIDNYISENSDTLSEDMKGALEALKGLFGIGSSSIGGISGI